jgi:uncharacterized protein YkuJ
MKKELTVEEFDALPKNEKAVLVAKDVLAQIDAKRYVPEVGRYLKVIDDREAYELDDNDDIRTNFDKVPQCQVCALGSMLLSCTRLGNKLRFEDIDLTGMSIYKFHNEKIKSLFESIFDGYQLLLIENAFEGASYHDKRYSKHILNFELNEDDFIRCNNFYNLYETDNERLIAICDNIIKNKGTFKI